MCRRLAACCVIAGLALSYLSVAHAQDLSAPPDALGSNPPVYQTLGMLDTTMSNVPEANCRICHSAGVQNRHHVLYGQPISNPGIVPYPDTNGDGVNETTFSCLSCHGSQFQVVRDCVACHDTGSPHHTGADAVNRHCTACHGDFVADYDDGHYIPSYNPSLVTPWTGLHGAGWVDQAHTIPYRESDGSGIVADTDVRVLDTGKTYDFGDVITRTDPAEIRIKPAGDDNDFKIEEANRGSFVYNVVFLQGSTLGAVWTQDSTTMSTLTVTVAPTQTADELITAINGAVNLTTGPRVFASKLLTDGTGDLLPDHDYAPLGGQPFNNRGFGAGSCSYCHDDDGALDVNGDPSPLLVLNNHDTHHGLGLPNNMSNGAGGSWRRCNVCHDYTTAPRTGTYDHVSGPGFDMHIRICEECHSVQTLHNIQADSPASGNVGSIVVGGEMAGYGHVGRDGAPGDSDCWGCHGFEATASSAPFAGALVPSLYNADVATVSSGKNSLVLLSGAAFTNTANGQQYTSNVTLTAEDGTAVTLTPDVVMDQGTLAVTVPSGTKPGNYKLQATKGSLASNPTVLSVVPTVKITSAIANGPVTITGTGFGGYAKGSGTIVTATVAGTRLRGTGATTVQGTIISWSDTKIVARFRQVPQTVSVQSVFGGATARVRQQ